MSRRLPPLGMLRVFEAAARHRSFTRAAAELNVTQSAVSHQIRALEDWLGRPLFVRRNRSLDLTDAASTLAPPLTRAFDQMDDAVRRVARDEAERVLTVSAMPSFASRWLLPRLEGFQRARPDLDVLIQTSLGLADFARQDVDLALRFGRGPWPGLECQRLLDDAILPVCSPRLLTGPHPLVRPDDLAHHTLLHDDFIIGWAEWLQAQGVTGVDARRGPRFTDSALILQLAVEGRGVALARRVLASRDLAEGRLVRPFGDAVPIDLAYWIVAPAAHFRRPKVAAFRDWILREAAEETAAAIALAGGGPTSVEDTADPETPP